jgi:hypothetical protein
LAGALGQVVGPMAAFGKIPLAASFLGKVGQGAAMGAGTGLTQPVMEGSVFGEKPSQAASGAAFGAAIPAVLGAGGAAFNMARNIADPFMPGGAERVAGRIANAAAGDKRAEILNLLQQNRQMVPGSQAAAGEVAAPAGSAEFSGLQKIVESLKPSDYVAQRGAQDAARVAAVQSVGQDKAALTAAEAARTAHANANYAQAYQQAVNADPKLAIIASNEFYQDALPTALKIAQTEGINPKTDLTKFLHIVKEALDDKLNKTGESAIGARERRSVQLVKERLVDWIKTKNPAYDKARQEFAKDSVPINQMEVGQFLENKLTSPVETGKQRAHAYASALREAPRSIRQATGFKVPRELNNILTPQQVQSVTGVADDLARRAQHEQLSSAGTKRASDIISETLPAAPASGMFSPTYSVIRAVVNNLTGHASSKALEALAVRMQDPAELAKVMQQLPPATRQKVLQEVMRAGAISAGAAQ